MINLQVDEAYAFDYLSILEVKKNLCPSDNKQKAFIDCKNYLSSQVLNFEKIFDSNEYKNLYNINKQTFELIDLVRNDAKNITAKQVDDINMERFYKKQELQKAFFPSALVEEKII